MPYFVKKPVVIFAEEIEKKIEVETLEGVMTGNPGDMLITGVKGEKYPCKKDIFEASYEQLNTDPEDGQLLYGGNAKNKTECCKLFI